MDEDCGTRRDLGQRLFIKFRHSLERGSSAFVRMWECPLSAGSDVGAVGETGLLWVRVPPSPRPKGRSHHFPPFVPFTTPPPSRSGCRWRTGAELHHRRVPPKRLSDLLLSKNSISDCPTFSGVRLITLRPQQPPPRDRSTAARVSAKLLVRRRENYWDPMSIRTGRVFDSASARSIGSTPTVRRKRSPHTGRNSTLPTKLQQRSENLSYASIRRTSGSYSLR